MKVPIMKNGFPSEKMLDKLLDEYGLEYFDKRCVSIITEFESDRVGYSYRGKWFIKKMEDFEYFLSELGITIRFKKATEERVIFYIKRKEDE